MSDVKGVGQASAWSLQTGTSLAGRGGTLSKGQKDPNLRVGAGALWDWHTGVLLYLESW